VKTFNNKKYKPGCIFYRFVFGTNTI